MTVVLKRKIRRRNAIPATIASLVLTALCPSTARAQVPRVAALYPPGLQRGQSATLLLTGEGLGKGDRLLFSSKEISCEIVEAAGDGHTLKVRVTATKEAPLGIHEMRVIGPKGASNARFVEVGAFPEAGETEPNDAEDHATVLPRVPVTVSGRITPADRDNYRMKVGAGETWVFRLHSSPLGSPLDGSLTLRDGKGREIASAVQLPEIAPCIVHTFGEAQEVTVTVRDLKYAGGEDFLYRLTVGPYPLAKYPLPLGLTRGVSTRIHWEGINLPSGSDGEILVPAGNADSTYGVTPAKSAPVVPPLELPVSPWPELSKTGSIPSRQKAMPLADLPAAVSGVLDRPGGADFYRFTAPKTGKVYLEVFARRLGARTDPILRITDLSGKEVGANDDAEGNDSRLSLELKPGNAYFASVGDVPGGSGPDYFYRLVLTTDPAPDVTLRAYPDTVNLGPGGTAVLRVYADRKDGFNGVVDVIVAGLPEGVTARAGAIPSGADSIPVTLTATAPASGGGFIYRIEGSARIGDRTVRQTGRPVNTPDRVSRTPISPPPLCFQMLGIGDPPSFTLDAGREEITVKPGESVTFPLRVNRKPGEAAAAAGEIVLETEGAPQGWTVESPPVPADKSEGAVTVKVPVDAPAGSTPILVYGRMGDQRYPAPLIRVKVDKG